MPISIMNFEGFGRDKGGPHRGSHNLVRVCKLRGPRSSCIKFGVNSTRIFQLIHIRDRRGYFRGVIAANRALGR